MFACPNSGSQVFLIARRGLLFWRHPQERELRPINDSVTDTQQIVLAQVVHAQRRGSGECPIPVWAFAGESDNIVSPASSKSVFPRTGVLPGDHFSIIRPDSIRHRSYMALKKHVLATLGHGAEDAPGLLPGYGDTSGASRESSQVLSISFTPGQIEGLSSLD